MYLHDSLSHLATAIFMITSATCMHNLHVLVSVTYSSGVGGVVFLFWEFTVVADCHGDISGYKCYSCAGFVLQGRACEYLRIKINLP